MYKYIWCHCKPWDLFFLITKASLLPSSVFSLVMVTNFSPFSFSVLSPHIFQSQEVRFVLWRIRWWRQSLALCTYFLSHSVWTPFLSLPCTWRPRTVQPHFHTQVLITATYAVGPDIYSLPLICFSTYSNKCIDWCLLISSVFIDNHLCEC